jgi:hypothetical protein
MTGLALLLLLVCLGGSWMDSQSHQQVTAFVLRQPLLIHHHHSRQHGRSHSQSNIVTVQFWSRSDPPLSSIVSPSVSKNYTLAYIPEDHVHLHENQRLVCIGDVHGDVEALKDLLEVAEVYSRQTDQWIGGNAIVVQCGDVLDRGTQELQCYSLLGKLSHQALDHKGKVICLVGNHEVLNAMGLFQYAIDDVEYENTIGRQIDDELQTPEWRRQYVNNQPARWASYEPGGLLAASLMANMKVAVRVGRTVLVHAGIKPHHLQGNGGIEGMNQSFRDWITLSATSGWGGENPVVYNNKGRYAMPDQSRIDAEKRQTYYINSVPDFLKGGPGHDGPIWMRDYSFPHDSPPKHPLAQELIDQTLDMLNADRMVMGHTIQRQINCALNGKAWRVDVGASRGCIAGTPEVLEIARLCTSTEHYGASCEERISILTKNGRIPAEERHITAMANFL